ncbi:RHS repeat-associated core domain-containing protein [Streptomyces sp. YPW6]|uniref:RHS repeat-associated core domain-containing protein n=1 Tax=Streptomyces sp. YPW6 TaxID=2840373 RepID=UPI003EBE886B
MASALVPERPEIQDRLHPTAGRGLRGRCGVGTELSLDRVARQGTTAFSYDGGSNNLLSDGTTVYSRTPHGALLASRQGTAAAQWAITDRHTDAAAGLSPDGSQVISSTAYASFGQVRAFNGSTSALGFQSGWTDEASGDANAVSRWYQPGTGGFSSRDTWQLDPSPSVQANRYFYGNAEPLNGIDPSVHDVSVGAGGSRRCVPQCDRNIMYGVNGGRFQNLGRAVPEGYVK